MRYAAVHFLYECWVLPVLLYIFFFLLNLPIFFLSVYLMIFFYISYHFFVYMLFEERALNRQHKIYFHLYKMPSYIYSTFSIKLYQFPFSEYLLLYLFFCKNYFKWFLFIGFILKYFCCANSTVPLLMLLMQTKWVVLQTINYLAVKFGSRYILFFRNTVFFLLSIHLWFYRLIESILPCLESDTSS
jgi:hypothetical protein